MEPSPRAINLEKFKEFVKRLTVMVEDYTIERNYLWALITENRLYTDQQIKDAMEHAKHDPAYRERAHQQFAEAWRLLDELGKEALFEAHILDTPPTDKPN